SMPRMTRMGLQHSETRPGLHGHQSKNPSNELFCLFHTVKYLRTTLSVSSDMAPFDTTLPRSRI
ncbi:MAG: hypothetical protein RLZZ244_2580, partial [Verrucomicrobiota bacterium]